MAKHNVLVGGSVPLQFFERVVWHEEPLILYYAADPAKDGHEAVMEKYLRENEGYEFTDKARGAIDIFRASFVRGGVRKDSQFPKTPGITINGTKWAPILSIMQFGGSTLLTNCFSWNKAYSMFPLTTFVHRKAFVVRSALNSEYLRSIVPQLSTYAQRGWEFEYQIRQERADDEASDPPLRHTRRIGDHYVWTIPLDTKGIECTQANPDYVIEHSAFSVWPHLPVPSLVDCSAPKSMFTGKSNFVALPFTSDVLRYRYTFGADGWPAWIGKVMTYKTLEELHRLPRAARPATFDRLIEDPSSIHYLSHDFEKPDTWRYCDDEIPALYKEWQTTSCHPLP